MCWYVGTHGNRRNFAVQNADLIISFGSRLDTKSTGSPVSTFARNATKIVVDVDPSELSKFSEFGLEIDRLVLQDLRNANLLEALTMENVSISHQNFHD